MKFKEKHLEKEVKQLRERLQIVLHDLDQFFDENNYELVITSVLSDPEKDKELGRVSSSHSEKRAFDFRTKGIPKEFLVKVEKLFEERYSHWAAISKSTGLPNLIYYHGIGDNYHGHVSIKPYK